MRKTVLITGASAGIGAATARLLAAHNYDVAIGYNTDRAGAESVAQDVENKGAKAVLIKADVGKPAEIEQMFNTLDSVMPRLDALVNNAGIVDAKERVEEFSTLRLQTMFQVNVIGAILVARNAVRRMSTDLGGDGGSIVNISSAAARLGSANQYVDYAASKAAIDTFTKGLAEEVATCGIRVNAVRPGVIETEIHAKGGEPDRIGRIAPLVPMKRAGTADEIAQSVLWLLSDAAGYVTGAHLDVSGGR